MTAPHEADWLSLEPSQAPDWGRLHSRPARAAAPEGDIHGRPGAASFGDFIVLSQLKIVTRSAMLLDVGRGHAISGNCRLGLTQQRRKYSVPSAAS